MVVINAEDQRRMKKRGYNLDFIYDYDTKTKMSISPKLPTDITGEESGFLGYFKKIEYIPKAISLSQIKEL